MTHEQEADLLTEYKAFMLRKTGRTLREARRKRRRRRAAELEERRKWRRWWRKMKVRLVLWFALSGTACALAGAILTVLYLRRLGIVVWIQ